MDEPVCTLFEKPNLCKWTQEVFLLVEVQIVYSCKQTREAKQAHEANAVNMTGLAAACAGADEEACTRHIREYSVKDHFYNSEYF